MKYIKSFNLSENFKYHINNNIRITESIFRHGSESYFSLLKETRELFDNKSIELMNEDLDLFTNTDIGKFDYYNNELVPLDIPLEDSRLLEAEYKGKEVDLNSPKRNSGSGKKYYVYVKDPKSGNVKIVRFGDVHGGLSAKVSDPEARKSFASRHKCSTKKDRTTAGYWACNCNKYPNLWNGSTYPGYW